ncbi:MAG: hypothetical protein Q4C64_07520 [Erysipelotrichia bacterium]|nr:hypothetical protein [Erysipelotrichia bacterium]
MKLLNDYVYQCLQDYHNTFIMPKTYKELGAENILNDLKDNGFDCIIEERDCNHEYGHLPPSKKQQKKLRKAKHKDIIYVIVEK